METSDHIRWAFLRAEYARFGGRLAADGDPMLCSGVKRLPTLFTLPYWKVNPHTSTRISFDFSHYCMSLMIVFGLLHAGHAREACAGRNAH